MGCSKTYGLNKHIILSLIAALLMLLAAGCDNNDQSRQTSSQDQAKAGSNEAVPQSSGGESRQAEGRVAEAEAEAEPQIVATVNGAPISRSLLESQVIMADTGRMMFGGLGEESEAESLAADLNMRSEILYSLINYELACQEAIRRGYEPSPEELEKALNELKSEYEHAGDLSQALESYGANEEDLRVQMSRTMALKKWQESDFLSQIKVAPEEAKTFYDLNKDMMGHGDMVRASQIFITVSITASDEDKAKARAKAKAALARIKSGEDFGVVAMEMSDFPQAAANKGDTGWIEKDQAVAMMHPSVFNLKPGEFSEVIETPVGYYIYKVTGFKPAGVEPFESLKSDIIDFIANDRLEAAVRDKMIELYDKADIQILDPRLKTAFDGYMKDIEQTPPDAAPETAE